MKLTNMFSLKVLDYSKKTVSDAKVILKPVQRGEQTIELGFDKKRQAYRVKKNNQGVYLLRVEAQGYEVEERKITIGAGLVTETIMLGKQDMSFYYQGKVRVPFEPLPTMIGISVKPGLTEREEQELLAYAATVKLKQEPIEKSVRDENIRIFTFQGNLAENDRIKIQQRLDEHPLIRNVGQLVQKENDRVAFLTTELIVKFKPEVNDDTIAKVLKRFNLTMIRKLPYTNNAYLVRAQHATYSLLKICDELVKTDLVIYAEPNLVVTAVDLQINPTDFLYAGQWHIPLINLPLAWEVLQNANPAGVMPGNPGDLTFGSENTLIAVMDRGIQSQTVGGITTSLHADFNGTITSGSNKVSQFFDFANMVPNNDAPPNDHGMGCAGVSTALANNASVVVGENEGVSGAAPNCQVLGLIRPSGGTTIQYTDAYIWMAGFDPGWTADGVNYPVGTAFPAVISPGADVITNSFIMPTGGLMEDMFDFLTTFGRGGKGIPVFVAVGNSNTTVTADNTMAAYEKVIGIAASTDGDVKAGYSSYGPEVDVCAPSNGGAAGITTCDLVGGGNMAGHTGGGNDYRNNFGGTSSATPLAAGVAALMLSINPGLTWVQIRQILRDTAVKIDAANVNPIGQWIDTDGDGNIDFSQWYGYGRINAQAAVQAALDLVGIDPLDGIDTWIKENAADVGNVPSLPPYSPDVWVRNTDPALDNPADVTTHQSPIREQTNWVYANVRNRGAVDSLDVYVRISITRWAGTQYIYPDDFIPTGSPSTYPPAVMAPGTYLIGEAHIDSIPAGSFVTINMEWPADLIPPEEVTIDGTTYSWADSCLLVEVSPHDGPTPTGINTWDDNNICQRNITIINPDTSDDDAAFAFVIGNKKNKAEMMQLRIDRKKLPANVALYFDYINRETAQKAQTLLRKDRRKPFYPVIKNRKALFALPQLQQVRFPVLKKPRAYQMVALHAVGLKNLKKGDYQIDIYQEDTKGHLEGGINILIRKK